MRNRTKHNSTERPVKNMTGSNLRGHSKLTISRGHILVPLVNKSSVLESAQRELVSVFGGRRSTKH